MSYVENPPECCACGRPSSHKGFCSARRALSVGYKRVPKRRFKEHTAPAGNPMVLPDHHQAVVEGHTLFRNRIADPRSMPRLLKSASNNKKIGSPIVRGKLIGVPVYTLTLEERATCPADCARWKDCYGNRMQWSSRISPTPDLIPMLRAELIALARQHGVFMVRLHVLGDFYSVEYVQFWHEMLRSLPGLNVYGYTARLSGPIKDAVDLLNCHPRSWIRFSDGPESSFRAVTVDNVDQAAEAGLIVCPAQTGQTDCCATCALCWATDKTIAFLRH